MKNFTLFYKDLNDKKNYPLAIKKKINKKKTTLIFSRDKLLPDWVKLCHQKQETNAYKQDTPDVAALALARGTKEARACVVFPHRLSVDRTWTHSLECVA